MKHFYNSTAQMADTGGSRTWNLSHQHNKSEMVTFVPLLRVWSHRRSFS